MHRYNTELKLPNQLNCDGAQGIRQTQTWLASKWWRKPQSDGCSGVRWTITIGLNEKLWPGQCKVTFTATDSCGNNSTTVQMATPR